LEFETPAEVFPTVLAPPADVELDLPPVALPPLATDEDPTFPISAEPPAAPAPPLEILALFPEPSTAELPPVAFELLSLLLLLRLLLSEDESLFEVLLLTFWFVSLMVVFWVFWFVSLIEELCDCP
jgi:hypothetical protein